MRWFDLPPVWLVLALVLTRLSPWVLPGGPLVLPGVALFLLAGLLTLAALVEFRRARTTFVPRKPPSALITTGVFRWTRNPIYLADGLILAGISLIWGKVLGLVLVLPFLWMIRQRFILGEEAGLRAEFGAAFDDYARRTRRWL
jgi:protein-S-isoprenylcysteine O-methyltransferase Ste14